MRSPLDGAANQIITLELFCPQRRGVASGIATEPYFRVMSGSLNPLSSLLTFLTIGESFSGDTRLLARSGAA
jgi:hypothetical protein